MLCMTYLGRRAEPHPLKAAVMLIPVPSGVQTRQLGKTERGGGGGREGGMEGDISR